MSLGLRRTRSWLAACCLVVILASFSTAACLAATGLSDLAGPLRVMALNAQRGVSATAAANRLGIKTQGNLVQATILFRSDAAAAATGLGRYGGTVEMRRDRRVQALIPVDKLLEVASLPQVAQIAPVEHVIPCQGFGAAVSQGVQLTNAAAFHAVGLAGQGVKVAVIDTGFADLTAAEVPAGTPISFRSDQSTTAGNHGTAVAQIVADMAPACNMTLIAVDTELSLEQAIDYVIAQRFQVVNMSLGLDNGPFDGTSLISQAVNRACAAGIFWVNAAGNHAQRHWEGTWRDTNADGFNEFSDTKDFISLTLAAGVLDVSLSWFETAGALTDHDYDLVLYNAANPTVQVSRSAVTQNGDDPAYERLIAYVPAAGTYNLKIERVNAIGSSETPDRFHLFVEGYDIEPSLQHPENSLLVPAEATGAFTIGATRGSDLPSSGPLAGIPIDCIEPFSSRGPLGSNAKPNMVAPDMVAIGVSGGLDALNPFAGTSAASPHVAGAAALLLSEDPSRSAATLATLLTRMAIKIQPPAIPDTDINAYGAGRLSLRVGTSFDGTPPSVTIEFPANNSTITVASPRAIVSMTDNVGIDPATIQVWLDTIQIIKDGNVIPGSEVTDYVFDAQTGTARFQLNNLTRTRHKLQVQVSDTSANPSALATSNFRISTPTISAGLHMITLPYPDLATQDPGAVFGVPVEDLALVRWVPTDSRFSKYHVYPDEFASFSPPDQLVANPPAGLGYFLSLPVSGTLNVTASGLSTADYNIRLVYGNTAPKGWNLIGNPYEEYVDWGSVEFISSNGRQDLREAMSGTNPVTDGVLFEFVSTPGGGYYSFPADPTQGTMEPLKGYWLHVMRDATLVVHSTSTSYASATAVKPKAKPQEISAANWLLQLSAKAGKYEDPVHYLGVASKASDGYDIGLDVPEPPALVDALQMYLPSAAGNLAKDVRGATAVQEWNVDVACRLTNTPISIAWSNINSQVPRDVTLRLEDLDSGASVYMRTTNSYTFNLAEPGVRHLRVTASTGTGASLAVSGLTASGSRGGQAVLTYSVTCQADVAIEIRNMSGVLVRTIGTASAAPGTTQTVMWNGQSDRGVKAPSGKYFARITARAADGQTVQAIRPFEVSR